VNVNRILLVAAIVVLAVSLLVVGGEGPLWP
jgi:hypothetical protein